MKKIDQLNKKISLNLVVFVGNYLDIKKPSKSRGVAL